MALAVTPVPRNLATKVTFLYLEFEDLFVILGLAVVMNMFGRFLQREMFGISPPPAQAQFCLPCVIQAVLATISQTIGNWLSVINGVVSDIRKLYEQTIWPISAINLAKSQIQSIIARFRGVIQSIMTINPHTATLP